MISHVWPVPGLSGQEKRVYYVLKALRQTFHVTFLTFADPGKRKLHTPGLKQLCDEAIVLGSRYNASLLSRLVFKAIGQLYSYYTGLKPSNFAIGRVELTGARVQRAIKGRAFEAVIFEYWHAHHVLDKGIFRDTPTILDMHNILWQTYKTQVSSTKAIQKYRLYEERVWNKFDRLITINQDETDYVRERLDDDKVWYIPMGIELKEWPMIPYPENEVPRIAWYGGLGSAHNQRDALRVCEEIMPEIWQDIPDAEFWIIGSKPPQHLLELSKADSRVTVTGFVEDIAPALGRTDIVLCPWEGTYGFRSRLVEVMATGTPVITTHDAASGMNLDHGEGILFNNALEEWPAMVVELLSSPGQMMELRKKARQVVEAQYSLEATYSQLPRMIEAVEK